MKRLIRIVLPLFLGLAMIGGLFRYISSNPETIADIQGLDGLPCVALVAMTLLLIFSQGLILRAVVWSSGIRLCFSEWFGLVALTLGVNFILPLSGIGLRAAYLKKTKGFAYTSFAMTSIAIVLIEVILFSGGGVASLLYLWIAGGQLEWIPLSLLTMLIVGLALFMLLRLPAGLARWMSTSKFLSKIVRLLDDWQKVRVNKQLIKSLIVYTLFMYIANTLIFYFAFMALGLPTSLAASALISCISDLSLFFKIAPGALGTFDAAVVYSMGLFGVSIGRGIIVANLARLSLSLCLLVLAPIFSWLLFGPSQKIEAKTIVENPI